MWHERQSACSTPRAARSRAVLHCSYEHMCVTNPGEHFLLLVDDCLGYDQQRHLFLAYWTYHMQRDVEGVGDRKPLQVLTN